MVVVGKIMVIQRCPIPETCEYVNLHVKRNFADKIEVTLKYEDYPGLSV